MSDVAGVCLQCGKPCAEDFVTCSHECNVSYANSAPREEPAGWDVAPEGKELVDVSVVTSEFGVAKTVVHAWVFNKRMPRHCYYRLAPRMTRYDLEAVRKWRATEKPSRGDRVSGPDPAQLITVTVTPKPSADIEEFRKRGLAAAKEAFRDVMLEGADEAKSRGDHELRARFLEDYVFFEEGLQLVYKGREADG